MGCMVSQKLGSEQPMHGPALMHQLWWPFQRVTGHGA